MYTFTLIEAMVSSPSLFVWVLAHFVYGNNLTNHIFIKIFIRQKELSLQILSSSILSVFVIELVRFQVDQVGVQFINRGVAVVVVH